jgi:AbrB family looped-hinge helix DNA binding protein
MTKATMIGTSAVSKQGQITIPKMARESLKLNKGDVVEFLLTTENLLIIKKSDYDIEIEI